MAAEATAMKTSICTKLTLGIALAALLAGPAWGQPSPKPPGRELAPELAQELAGITQRGSVLAAYDLAAGYATGAFQATHPAEGKVERYIARQTATGWTVDFGRLNADATKFLTAYEAVQTDAPTHFAVGQFDPEREDTGFNLFAARGMELALTDFGRTTRAYRIAALRTGSAGILIYLYPAQTPEQRRDGVYPYGGDVRYLVSPDGTKVLDKHRMHNDILESTPAQIPQGSTNAAGYHTHVLSDGPEDTDVFLVLRRQPRVPEYVGAGGHVFKIEVDGTITVDPADGPPAH
jgi:hypothetical protein